MDTYTAYSMLQHVAVYALMYSQEITYPILNSNESNIFDVLTRNNISYIELK